MHEKHTQRIGNNRLVRLNDWAENLIEGKQEILASSRAKDGAILVFPSFRLRSAPKLGKCTRSFYDEFGNKRFLRDFIFPGGLVLHEVLQLAPTNSGTAYCTALQDRQGRWIKQSMHDPEEYGANPSRIPDNLVVTLSQ